MLCRTGDRKPDEEMMKIGDEDVEDEAEEEEDEEPEDDAEPESTLFVKNINFETVEDTLQEVGLCFVLTQDRETDSS